MLSPSDKEDSLNHLLGSRQAKDPAPNVHIPPTNGSYPIKPCGLWWMQDDRQMSVSPDVDTSGMSERSAHSSPTMEVSSQPSPSEDGNNTIQSVSTGISRDKDTAARSSSSSNISGRQSSFWPPNSAIKFSIESILSRPDRVRKVEEEVDIDQADSSSDILDNVHDCSSGDLKEDPREETSNSTKDCDENCHSSELYSWLQCTRYKPPKLPSKFMLLFLLFFAALL